MRVVNWLFVVSVALFVSGIGFVIAGARSARQAPAAETSTISLTPVASVKQIMKGIVGPAATAVFDSVTVGRSALSCSIPQAVGLAAQFTVTWRSLTAN